jgi:Purple acid Phosphatase, N-terminal domain
MSRSTLISSRRLKTKSNSIALSKNSARAACLTPITPNVTGRAKPLIIKGPELEFAREDLAIIRWTSTNPGGDDEHFAVIHYGTDPKDLSQTAKSHIRLNRTHAETMFRVRVDDLAPQTTYYYTVTSMGVDGYKTSEISAGRLLTLLEAWA